MSKPELTILKQNETYTFKYNSESDSIDLNTLLLSQLHFGTILNEIKNDVAGNADLKIRIRPLSKGSVPFDLTLAMSWLETLIAGANVNYISNVIQILTGLIAMRMFLKSKKPTKVEIKNDKVIVTIGDATIEIDRNTYNVYQNNATISKAFENAFDAIDKDEDVTGIEILDNQKKTIVNIPRKNFVDFTAPNEIFEERTQNDASRIEALTIFKVVFDKGYKWQFIQQSGRKISASINDDAFMERINRGERFAKGDTLVVEMEVEKKYDKSVDFFVEKGFKVLKVINHIPRPKQGIIDLENNSNEPKEQI